MAGETLPGFYREMYLACLKLLLFLLVAGIAKISVYIFLKILII
jgi:hypothetical protein